MGEVSCSEIAGRMFARWSQENFFRYLIADYDFDKMISFGVETIDQDRIIVNPEYRKVNHQLKKLREKIQRVEAKFYPLAEHLINAPLEEVPITTLKQMEYKSTLDAYYEQEQLLVNKRLELPPKIKLAQMPEQIRYNKLKTESKLLMNVIKMICYRAESAVASLITPCLGNPRKEKRMVVKQIIAANADLIPDYENNILTVVLHSMSANRFNNAAAELAALLNETETIFPGTNFRHPIPWLNIRIIAGIGRKLKISIFAVMGQLLLPLFPTDTVMITPTLGVREREGSVYYLHSGVPIYSHESNEVNKFRFFTSNLILQGLCSNQDIVDAFHVSTDSVRRWKKKLSEEGEGSFFKEESRHGRSHKLLPDVLCRIQDKLNEGRSASSIAKEEGISEGSIRYAVKQGRLKKRPDRGKFSQNPQPKEL